MVCIPSAKTGTPADTSPTTDPPLPSAAAPPYEGFDEQSPAAGV
jgi:hypothetical protein